MAALLWLKNKTQRLLQIDIGYFLKGGFWITFDNFINTVIAFLLGIVLTKLFAPSDYGTYRYIFSILGMLQIFVFGGMNSAVTQAVARGEEGAFKKVVNFRLRYSFIFISAAFIVAFYYFYNKNFQISYSLIALGLCYPISSALSTYQAFLQGKKEFRYSALISTISQTISTLLIIFFLFITKKVFFVVLTYSLVNLIINAYFFWKITNKLKPTSANGEGAVNYGKKLTFLQLFGVVAQQLDKIILFNFWGPAVLANYTIAQFFPDYIYSFLKSLSDLLIPKASSMKFIKISAFFYKRILQSLLIGTFISVSYIVIAPTLFHFLFQKYIDMSFYSQLLSFNILLALVNGFINSIFVSQKLIKSIYASQIISGFIRIILFTIMGISGGLLGILIADISSRTIGTFLNITLWELEKKYQNSLSTKI